MKTLLLSCLLLCCWLPTAFAQNASPTHIDSLQNALAKTAAHDTLRVVLLDELCWNLSRTDLPRARRYAEQGIALAQRIGYRRGEARCHNDLGTCLAFVGDADGALRHHLAALRLFKQEGMTKHMAYAYNGIANCHNLHRHFDTAEEFYLKALNIAEKRQDQADQALFLSNLADLTWQRGQPDRAGHYVRRALQLYISLAHLPGQANSLFTVGNVQAAQNRLDSARVSLLDALMLYRVLGDEYGLSGTYTNLSGVLVAMHKPGPALGYARLGQRYALKVGSPERLQNAYQQLAQSYAAIGQYGQAYEMQRRFQNLRDSLVTEVNARAMAALQSRYDAHERDARIRLLTQRQKVTELRAARDEEHVRLLGVAVGALLLLIIAGSILYGKLLRGRQELAAQHQLVADKNAALESAAHELQQLSDSKAQLYAIIAHDLRGPITAFAGVTELIRFYQRTNDQEGLRHLPELVRESAQSLNGLLDNLLNWAVSQTGELRCEPERLQVREMLSECYELFQTSAHANQIHLQYEADANLTLYADRNMVRTILRNLVGNALKFTPSEGYVRLVASPDPTDPTLICLAVVDTGPGLPTSQVQQLLHPRRAHLRASGINQSAQGTGLGLQLCRTFTECHGGSLGMTSGPDGGATVWVTLPAAGKLMEHAEPSYAPNPAARRYTAA